VKSTRFLPFLSNIHSSTTEHNILYLSSAAVNIINNSLVCYFNLYRRCRLECVCQSNALQRWIQIRLRTDVETNYCSLQTIQKFYQNLPITFWIILQTNRQSYRVKKITSFIGYLSTWCGVMISNYTQTKNWHIYCLPNHELGFSGSGHPDSSGQHVRIAWTEDAMRSDSNSSENVTVGWQHSLHISNTPYHQHAMKLGWEISK